jgi:hypothetical protein
MKNKNEKMNSLRQGSNQGPSNPLATALSITPRVASHEADDGKFEKEIEVIYYLILYLL